MSRRVTYSWHSARQVSNPRAAARDTQAIPDRSEGVPADIVCAELGTERACAEVPPARSALGAGHEEHATIRPPGLPPRLLDEPLPAFGRCAHRNRLATLPPMARQGRGAR